METKALKAKRPGFTDERYNETSYYVENGQYTLLLHILSLSLESAVVRFVQCYEIWLNCAEIRESLRHVFFFVILTVAVALGLVGEKKLTFRRWDNMYVPYLSFKE